MSDQKHVSDRARNLFVISFALILCWFMYDRLNVITNSTQQSATILNCENSWIKQRTGSSTSSTYRDVVVSAPVAMTDDGQKAIGTVKAPEKRCDEMVGTAVQVYIHKSDPKLNRINSFLQFWFFPSIFAFLAFAVLFNSKRPALGFLTTLGFLGFCGYMIAAELNYMNLGTAAISSNANMSPSQIALTNCIKREMLERDLTDRTELKRLLCQSAKITDLTSIQDLTNLEELYLQGNDLTDLSTLGYYPNLRKLSVATNPNLKTLSGIENAPNLEEFQANKSGLEDISSLAPLTKLRIIGAMMNNISDISALSDLNALQDVVLNYNPISDISPLTDKPDLWALQVYSSQVTDLTPIYGNTAITKGGVTSEQGYPCEQILYIKSIQDAKSTFHVPKQCQ